ncbi:hypothetical protein CDO73_08565 [Saccharibacillus sp. O23]|uniref:hypothetical protein n=1 Tax=Saccharibacillus sp. O23 TaxID=2009338 RepID=UPI000B4E4840|nr:hypothetical protein [Saccharibacillus sp. O23]OWR31179.1 hypothetical protein CDO73_08565 [Saccharibacillus sp. O23]
MINFELDPNFRKYRNRTRVALEGLNIVVANRAGQILHELYFASHGKIDWNQAEAENGPVRLDLVGTFAEPVSEEVLKVWGLWRESLPIRTNEWVFLDENLQKGWLDAVRYRVNRGTSGIGQTAPPFRLDQTGVSSAENFFLALGEAVVGPCGYYGWNALSLDDLLCCEPALVPPFDLVLVGANPDASDGWSKKIGDRETAEQLKALSEEYGVRFIAENQA